MPFVFDVKAIVPVFGSIVAGILPGLKDTSGVGFIAENPVTKGTGIGLYLIKQLVERNNGKITIESNEGNGSEFTLVFFNQKNRFYGFK